MAARQLILVCIVTAAWALSFGLGTQAVSHWLKAHDASDTLVGFVHAAYYLGVALASLAVPALTRRTGLACASLGMLLSAISLVLFPAGEGALFWLTIRLCSGAGCALSLIPLEAFLSQQSPPERRTETFAYYAVALTLAGALGIAVGLDCFDTEGFLSAWLGPPRNAFFLGAFFPLVGSMITQHGLARREWHEETTDRFRFAWKDHFLSFGTAWGQGFLEGGLLAFLSLHLVAQGLSTSTAGAVMGVTMVGVILFQVPVGWLADRLGPRPVLLACYGVVLTALVVVPCCRGPVALGFWLFLLGACSGAMYPLGLSLLGDRLSAGALARAYSWYLAMECVGSQAGSAAMGSARDLWGGSAMFVVGAVALAAVLLLWLGGTRRETKTALPQEWRKAA